MKLFFTIIGIVVLVSIIFYTLATIFYNIQERKVKKMIEEDKNNLERFK